MQTLTKLDNLSFPKAILKLGMRGEEVVELQRLLAYWHSYTGWIDGEFTAQLEKNVKSWQRRVFLPETGIVCDLTWQALYNGSPVNMPIVRLGSEGEAVTIVQNILRITDNYWGEITGEFDLFTDTALRDFQRRHGLMVDGIVGDHTWRALSKVSHKCATA